MENPDIVRYVKEQLQKGISPEAIRTSLLGVGWKAEDIAEALKNYGSASAVEHPKSQGFSEELKSLRQTLQEVSSRLSRLEAQAATPGFEEKPAPESSYIPLRTPSLAVEKPTASAPVKTESVESRITGKWFAGVGIIAILFGVGFFLKYAFESNLIGVHGRIGMGIVAGLALLLLGDFLSRREQYRQYSFFLSGGGLALLYLSIYSAFSFYHLIDQATAFSFLVLITGGGTALAVKSGGQWLAGLALLGGFLTPFLVSTGVDNEIVLFSYVLILDLSFLGVSYFKKWMSIYLLAFFGTYAVFYSWFGSYYDKVKLQPTIFFLTLFFLVFLAAPFLRSVARRVVSSNNEVIASTVNAAFYFSTFYMLLRPDHRPYLGFLFVFWAALHLLLAYTVFSRNPEDSYGIFALGGVGLVLLTLAIPIQLHSQWITMAWAAEAAVLLWVGFMLKSYNIRFFANVVSAVTVVRLLFFEISLRGPLQDFTPFFNERFSTFLIAIVSLFVAAVLYRSHEEDLNEGERSMPGIYGVVANLFAVLALSNESLAYFDRQIEASQLAAEAPSVFGSPQPQYGYGYGGSPEVSSLESQKSLSLSILWGLYSGILMVVGILRHSRYARLLSILGLGVVVLKVFLYDSSSLSDLYRIISFIALGVILLIISFLFYRYKEKIKQFIFA